MKPEVGDTLSPLTLRASLKTQISLVFLTFSRVNNLWRCYLNKKLVLDRRFSFPGFRFPCLQIRLKRIVTERGGNKSARLGASDD